MVYLLELMEGQTEEEDNEEMVSVPKHLKVGAADELKGGGDHQEQSHSDNVTRDTSSCHKTNGDGILGGRKKGRRERDRRRETKGEREKIINQKIPTILSIKIHHNNSR